MWRSAWRVSIGVAGSLVPLVLACAAVAYTPDVLTGIVVYVDDGDTIDVRIGDRVERVRYIGVDAPEIEHAASHGRRARPGAPGGAAAARLNAALVAGRTVRLDLDVEARDRYGRLLAYVWLGETMINAELVARGYARVLPIPPNLRHAALLATLETEARAAHRGLWATGDLMSEPPRPRIASVRASLRGSCARATSGRRHCTSSTVGISSSGNDRTSLPASWALADHAGAEHFGPLHCARPDALVSYGVSAARSPAPPIERRLWRSTRISRSTPSIGCSKVSSFFRGSRRWCACLSISNAPTSAAASTPPR